MDKLYRKKHKKYKSQLLIFFDLIGKTQPGNSAVILKIKLVGTLYIIMTFK